LESFFEHAGCWFLHSGIQTASGHWSGGVARFYRSDTQSYASVSNEISGYAASTFAYLGETDALVRTASYLSRHAWDTAAHTFPFEPASPLAFFFDIGIMVRGLLAAWRTTGEEEFLACARDGALSLAFDFLDAGFFHPVISLPEKQPVEQDARWSRTPGCYQLKSALAWRDLGDPKAARLFESALDAALKSHAGFLDAAPDAEKTMDRLHAYCYFLEALLWETGRADVLAALASGIARVATLLREIAPRFERSDVCAQLLRVRLIAHHLGAVELDENAACEEARRAARYQSFADDPRLRGGFWFGERRSEMLPFMNPVSTAFCLQALDLWRRHQSGAWTFELHQLI
jgi:hypothetical protein